MPSTPQPLVLLLDGYALIHRAYHAIPPLSTRRASPRMLSMASP